MILAQLLPSAASLEHSGDLHKPVQGLHFDSRAVGTGDVFVAVRGVHTDGHQYITTAIERGATAVICEQIPDHLVENVTYVRVADSAEILGQMASAWCDHPSHSLHIVGVTGTNGKTTVTTLLHQLFTALGYRCGMLGTVENRIGNTIKASTHTTPDAVQLHRLLREMADAGCQYVFMEVSSHAVHQRRIAGVRFAGGVFTNLTHDHLDYHGTFAAYRDAKKRFFDDLPADAFALTNTDDRNGMVMLQNTKAQKNTYSLKKIATFKGKILENALEGLHLLIDDEELHARLIGEFNAYNLLAAYGVAQRSGMDKMETLTALSNLTGAEGRFDALPHPDQPGCLAIVDYAHTPDALEKVLETIRQLKKKTAQVITVVGCGGDRDKTKRPLMAQIAARLSQQVVLTSDNPRTEDPQAILQDMEAGLTPDMQKNTLTISDRAQAIRTAKRLARPGDVVLIAGKGHEKYQEINGVKYPFDDKEVFLRE
jgi:UDP-N-acetylmuramoyl-L-alanyl-D-glutamate--2,6-diaminopimelate ligase